uniref:ARM repeat superfamily protein n=1 Tax=Timema monikensis TaxID=170555 RepID=A0A7R9HT52_9NEOP|nr:unnamed protein product [Timema monikensis]
MDSQSKDAQVFMVVLKLIEAAADKEETVRKAVMTSLRKLSKKHPSEVLRHAVDYRKRNAKTSARPQLFTKLFVLLGAGPHTTKAHNLDKHQLQDTLFLSRSTTKQSLLMTACVYVQISVHHQAALLHTMEHICLDHLSEVDGDVVLLLVQFSIDEMTRSPDYLPVVQMPASGILVALGKAHCNEVMEGLLKHLQPGVVPHYSILHTMGSLAAANVFGIVPFVKATLGTLLPMMGGLRSDALRQVFSYTLGKFSEAVADYLVNIDHAPDPTVKLGAFSTEMGIAYDVLASSWLHSRDPKVCETVLGALGPMFALLPADKVAEQVPRLVPALLALYRRNMDPHPVTQCLAAVLLVVISGTKTSLEPHLDNLLNVMFDLVREYVRQLLVEGERKPPGVCTSPDYAQPLTVKNHYEVLRCFDRIGWYSDITAPASMS